MAGKGLGPLACGLLVAGLLLEVPVALLPRGLVLLLAVRDGLAFGPAWHMRNSATAAHGVSLDWLSANREEGSHDASER